VRRAADASRLREPEPSMSVRRLDSNWMRCWHASKIFDFTVSSVIAALAFSTLWMRWVS
jgi:hypothetical protein